MSIYGGGGSANGELTRADGLQNNRKPLILRHITVDDAHTTGLNRSLYNLESRKGGRSKLVYLPGILYHVFHLQIILLSDVLAADDSSKFYLGRNKESRQ